MFKTTSRLRTPSFPKRSICVDCSTDSHLFCPKCPEFQFSRAALGQELKEKEMKQRWGKALQIDF